MGISVQQATLVRGKTTIHASGQLHAHQTSHHHEAFDDESALNATVSVQNAPLTDLLTMTGTNVPVTGTLDPSGERGRHGGQSQWRRPCGDSGR